MSVQQNFENLTDVKIPLEDLRDEFNIDTKEEFESGIPWKEMSTKQKVIHVIKSILRPIFLLACLYFFICSLDLMSTAFQLIAGKYAGELLGDNELLKNPLAGLMMGILATVVVQSSSTSTSIVVTMVASGILKVEMAIPIIMGANIGTSITSALVSLGQVSDKVKFRRAFSGATVHDMFNWLSVLVLLPIEVIFGYLNKVTKLLVDELIAFDIQAKEPELLHAITKPFTDLIIQLDKAVLKNITIGAVDPDVDLRKHICEVIQFNATNSTEETHCHYLFESVKIPEWSIGLILLIGSLLILVVCLVIMVKILNSLFIGPVAKLIKKVVNAEFPGPFRYFSGYVAILLGCLLTIVVQSSSVFMSTLTPLVGMGVVSIERVFPLALGSNIGTTVTGLLAAFSASSSTLKFSLQIALCHTLFNVTGILIWYPIPYLRKLPLALANQLGKTSSEYRWFVVVYILTLFFIVPLLTFGLSSAGWKVAVGTLGPFILFIIIVIIINILQSKFPRILPKKLRNWDFLPEALHSLEPYDRFITKKFSCCKCVKAAQIKPKEENEAKEFGAEDVTETEKKSEPEHILQTTYL